MNANIDAQVTLFVDVLLSWANDADLSAHAARVQAALVEATHSLPGDWPETWSARLVAAGSQLGLRVTIGAEPLPMALSLVAHRKPVVLVSCHRGLQAWRLDDVARGQVRVDPLGDAEDRRWWCSTDELCKALGVAKTEVVHWAIAEPLEPCHAGENTPAAHAVAGPGPHSSRSPWWRLLQLLWPDRREVLSVIVFAVAVGFLSLASPIAVEALVNTLAFSGLMQPVLVLALLLGTILALANAMLAAQAYLVEIIQRRLVVRVVSDLAYRLPRLSADALHGHDGPELVNRFFDTFTVQKAAASLLTEGSAMLVSTLVGMAVLAFYHPLLLGFDIALVATIGFLFFVLGRGAVRTALAESRSKYAVAAWLESLVREPLIFRGPGGRSLAWERANRLTLDHLGHRAAHFRVLYRQYFFILGLQAFVSAGLLGVGGWLVISGQLTLGQLVAAELIIAVILGSFGKLGKLLDAFYDALAATDKLGHLFDLATERSGGGAALPSQRGMRVTASGVTVAGPDRARLATIDFDIQAGERVAVFEASGAHQSTLAELVYGLIEPGSGSLSFDELDSREWQLDRLREQVAMVRQATFFDGTIFENVRAGRSEVTSDDVRRALETVGVLEPLRRLPAGLQTRLWSHDVSLSDSQQRRVAIARAVAGAPRLLVLDQSLDMLPGNERQELFDRLAAPQHPWTLLVITRSTVLIGRCGRCLRLSTTDAPQADEALAEDQAR